MLRQQDAFNNTSLSIPELMNFFDGLDEAYTPGESLQQVTGPELIQLTDSS